MELLTDVVFLSRLQFAMTIIFHFLFVPLSIGLGLFVALSVTRACKTKDPVDEAHASLWVKIFTLTFTVGVATGITMEFGFGTNWANYSRFVGDIFGSPLAAEALLAFFLESSFLGVLLFGKKRVSPRFYTVSAWLVWVGSMLSALWILIANSWMQTPAGYVITETGSGTKAQIVDFFAAVANPQTVPTYFHTVIALIIFGAFIALAIASYYRLHGRNDEFVTKMVRWGAIVALVATFAMMPVAHMQAKTVADEQPTKLAAMEGQYKSEAVPMYLFGIVDTENGTVIGPSIPGLTSFLASGSFDTVYPGLDDIEKANPGSTPTAGEVQVTFQSYHIMIVMMGLICLGVLLALILTFGKKLKEKRWPYMLFMFLWIAPFLAIQTGWMTAEIGRQPWIVTGELKTLDAISPVVPAEQLLITVTIFLIIYLVILIAWVRIFCKFVKEGPEKILAAPAKKFGAKKPAEEAVVVEEAVVADDEVAEDEAIVEETVAVEEEPIVEEIVVEEEAALAPENADEEGGAK